MQAASPVPRIKCLPIALAALVSTLPVSAHAGALNDIQDTASPPPSRPAPGPSQPAEPTGDESRKEKSDGHHVERGESSWTFLRFIFLMPWALPRFFVDDPCKGGFAAYPYADARGNLRHDPRLGDCALAPVEPIATRRWAMQTEVEGSYALADLAGGTLAARLQLPRRIEFAGRVSFLRDLRAEPREQALHGTAHMSVRFAQAPRIELRTGAGIRAFSLDRPLYGLDLVYAMDVFGRRPIVGRLELHVGTLGKAGAGEARLALGYVLGKVELYAGYDHTVFWTDQRTTRVSGPLAGVRAWF